MSCRRSCGGRRAARRPALAAVHRGGRRHAARPGRRAHGPARAALRHAAAGRPPARPGDADAGRELRRAALQARGQLGPGHASARSPSCPPPRPTAARCRSIRTCSSRSSTSSACTRSTSASNARDRLARLRVEHDAGDRRRPPLARLRRRRPGVRGRASAASCGRSSAPASPTRCSRGGCSSPTSRAWARPSRRSPRSRRTTPTRRS